MSLREAAQQALAALDEAKNYTNCKAFSPTLTWECEEAIAALKAALAEDAMQKLTDVQQEMERSIEAALPKELKLEEQVNRDLPVGCKRCANPLWAGTKCSTCGKDWTWTKEQT